MTEDRSLLLTLTLADDTEFFELLRGVEKSECTRCKTGERVRKGSITDDGSGRRQEMRCACGWTWSVAMESEAS